MQYKYVWKLRVTEVSFPIVYIWCKYTKCARLLKRIPCRQALDAISTEHVI